MFLVVLITLFISSAHSTDCENIRLDAPGEAMENVKHKDQGALGICFSHAGSALFDAYRASSYHGSIKQSSPLEAAAGTLEERISNRIQISGVQAKQYANFDSGGTTCEIVNYLMQNGGCSDSNVALERLDPSHREIYLQAVQELFYESTINRKELHQKALCRLPLVDKKLSKMLFPFKQIRKSIHLKNFGEFLKSILSKRCSKGKRGEPLGGVECVEIPKPWQRKSNPTNYIPVTRKHLSKHKQPVSISFCSNILRAEPWYQGLEKNELQLEARKSDCGLHEAIIIGMRKVKTMGGGGMSGTSCQYLIRNSWEKDSKYSPYWESENNGNLWVDEESLFQNVEGLSFLKQN